MTAYDPEMLKISQEYLTDKYMEDTDTWGIIDETRWNNYTNFMQEYGVIDTAISPDACFTNEFLPE